MRRRVASDPVVARQHYARPVSGWAVSMKRMYISQSPLLSLTARKASCRCRAPRQFEAELGDEHPPSGRRELIAHVPAHLVGGGRAPGMVRFALFSLSGCCVRHVRSSFAQVRASPPT